MENDAIVVLVIVVALPVLLILRRVLAGLFTNETTIQPPESYGAPVPLELNLNPVAGMASPSAAEPGAPDAGRIQILDYAFLRSGPGGPGDPLNFYDELRLKLRNPEDGYEWEASFYVCTPQGLQGFMKREGWQYIFGADHIIVPGFEIPLILDAVLDFYETMGRLEIHPPPRQDAL